MARSLSGTQHEQRSPLSPNSPRHRIHEFTHVSDNRTEAPSASQAEAKLISNAMLTGWIYSTFKARVSRSTLTRLRGLPSSYFSYVNMSATKHRRVKFPQFERELREFFFRNEAKTTMADDILLLKARELEEKLKIDDKQLRLSNGWLQSFKTRNGICSHTLSGERGSVDTDALRDARLLLQNVVTRFAPEDMFNFDERARVCSDFAEAVGGNEMEELTAMMRGWEGAISASDYVAVDDDEDVHEPDVIADEEVVSEELEEEEESDPAVTLAVALRHCLELSAFLLQCGEETDSERRSPVAVTALVRETAMQAKRQRTMHDLFVCTT